MAGLPQRLQLLEMQQKWASQLDPVLKNPVTNPGLLQSVSLVSGANVVNHKLGQNLQGWIVTRMRGSFVQIYDTQDSNQTPQLTLNLHSSGSCVVDILVF